MADARVKIEGLRDAATARAVAALGADAIGLVFADSPRRVSPEQAHAVVEAVPPRVATIGVFVNETPEAINRIAEQTGIDYVQLHGDEPAGMLPAIRRPCIKAFRVCDESWLDEVRAWLADCQPPFRPAGVLLDAYDASARGGTGKWFNWNLVATAGIAGKLAHLVGPIILAGGLDAACVAQAIKIVAPWGVDVASGVESAPGVKDLVKVDAFIRAAGAAGRGWWL